MIGSTTPFRSTEAITDCSVCACAWPASPVSIRAAATVAVAPTLHFRCIVRLLPAGSPRWPAGFASHGGSVASLRCCCGGSEGDPPTVAIAGAACDHRFRGLGKPAPTSAPYHRKDPPCRDVTTDRSSLGRKRNSWKDFSPVTTPPYVRSTRGSPD